MSKQLILIAISILLCGATASAQPGIGKSTGRWKEFGAESMERHRQGGVAYVEVTINDLWRTAKSHDEIYTRADKLLTDIKTAGVQVWSVHLPFSRKLDISVSDDSLRRANVKFIAEMIRLAKRFEPRVLVLHPSSEPIDSCQRAERLAHSHASIGLLAPVAREIGATLCIENLPRTCLGQTGEELLQLIDGYDDVRLCFDTNHLLFQSHADYLKAVGTGRIGTVHLSDYDFKDERHWLPGKGGIDWGALWQGICNSGYTGVMLFECHGEPEELTAARDFILREAGK